MQSSESTITADAGILSAAKTGKLLSFSAKSWFVVASLGMFTFAAYIIGLYGFSAIQGDWARWSTAMPHGITKGDAPGNVSIALHLLLAAIVNIAGPLQLIPGFRKRFPVWHRWSGRVYVSAGIIISLTGLVLVWGRGTVGGMVQHVSTSVNGLLIILCAIQAIRFARAKNFRLHRVWALRLFLVMSGVWFFRVGLMFWLTIHQAPVGFDPETFQGPFLTFLNVAQYLLPLVLLECCLAANRSSKPLVKAGVAALLLAATAVTAVGVFAAAMGMWIPRM